MNKSKIEWTDYTWNPVTGCFHGCSYCYARRIAKRFNGHFQPMFHEDRLFQPLKHKKPSKIFVCSMADLFGSWVDHDWIYKVLDIVSQCPQHTFQFLTKNPARYKNYSFPDNCWVGATITTQNEANIKLSNLGDVRAITKFVSLEPLLEEVLIDYELEFLDWVIVGAMTGSNAIKVKSEWVESIIEGLSFAKKQGRTKAKLFLKDNLNFPVKIQEFPPERTNHA